MRAVAGQYRDQGKYDEAIATLQGIPTKTADVQAELAYTYGLAGKQQEAANLYSRLAKGAKGNIGLDLSARKPGSTWGAPMTLGRFSMLRGRSTGITIACTPFSRVLLTPKTGPLTLRPNITRPSTTFRHVCRKGRLPIELRLNLYEIYVQQDESAKAKGELQAASAAVHALQVPDSSRPELLRLRAAVEAASGDLDNANRDLKEALALTPGNVNALMNFGMLRGSWDRSAARATFLKVLDVDHSNRQALSALGYLARDAGDAKLAESYFAKAAAAHPKDFAPYLALGDLYTAQGNLKSAEANYENAFQRMPSNALIIAGGANAAMEAHDLNLAQRWLQRANGKANSSPQVQRELERLS